MRRTIIAANWKLNMLRHEAQSFLATFRTHWGGETSGAGPEIVIAPPFTALDTVARALAECEVALAGQNVFFESSERLYFKHQRSATFSQRAEPNCCAGRSPSST